MTAVSADVALFPGTFDPFTCGHLDLASRAARLFPRLTIAVARSSTKTPLFTVEERVEMAREALAGLPDGAGKGIEVTSFEGLVVDFARTVGARVMIRGLRAVSDFEFEFQMALMNRRLAPAVEVVYLMPDERFTYLSAALLKEVARLGGDVSGLLPEAVYRRVMAKLGRTVRA